MAASATALSSHEYEWPPRSCARIVAGLRSALKTDCSGFKFQNGGRNLRWLTRTSQTQRDKAADCAGVFWSGHTSLLETQWSALAIPAALSGFDLFRHVNKRHQLPRDRRMDLQSVERVVRWAVNPDAAVAGGGGATRGEVREWFLSDWSEHDRSWLAFADGFITLLAFALEHGWTTWLVNALRERHRANRTVGGLLRRLANSGGGGGRGGGHGGGGGLFETSTAFEQSLARGLALAALLTGSMALVEQWTRPAVRVMDRGHPWRVGYVVGGGGSMDVLLWARTQPCLGECLATSIQEMTSAACQRGKMAFVQQLVSHPVVGAECRECMMHFGAFDSAAIGGHLALLRWLDANDFHEEEEDEAMTLAAKHGHLEVVHFLHTTHSACAIETAATVAQHAPAHALPLIELLFHTEHCTLDADVVVSAVSSHNVRPDLLRFLATHVDEVQWRQAFERPPVDNDLDLQDLLHAAAAAAVSYIG